MNVFMIIVATVLAFGIGAVWYSPILFGSQWMKLGNITVSESAKKRMWLYYLVGIISTGITAVLFSFFHQIMEIDTMTNAIWLAIFVWFAFQVPIRIGSILWESRPIGFSLINSGYELLMLIFFSVFFTLM